MKKTHLRVEQAGLYWALCNPPANSTVTTTSRKRAVTCKRCLKTYKYLNS